MEHNLFVVQKKNRAKICKNPKRPTCRLVPSWCLFYCLAHSLSTLAVAPDLNAVLIVCNIIDECVQNINPILCWLSSCCFFATLLCACCMALFWFVGLIVFVEYIYSLLLCYVICWLGIMHNIPLCCTCNNCAHEVNPVKQVCCATSPRDCWSTNVDLADMLTIIQRQGIHWLMPMCSPIVRSPL